MSDWIESRTNLARHRKTRHLAELLSIPRPLAVGYLTCWWHRIMEESPEGDLTLWTAGDHADAALYEGEPEAFQRALIDAGFLESDPDGQRPHDWDDYAGRLLDRRRKNAERMRIARAGTPQPPVQNGVANVQHTSRARAGLPTGPDQPDQPVSVARAPVRLTVDETFKLKLEDEFCEALGSRETVRDRIDAALAHTSRQKYTDDGVYLRHWLRGDVERGTGPPGRNGRPEPKRRIVNHTGCPAGCTKDHRDR